MAKPRLPVLKSPATELKRSRANMKPVAPDPSIVPCVVDPQREELQRKLALYSREWRELIERMKLSDHFKNATDKCDLLDWYFSRLPEKATDTDMEVGFYNNQAPLSSIETGRSRVALREVRKRLKAFKRDERGEKWLLDIPVRKGGSWLNFTPSNIPISATHSFWNVHLRSFEDPTLITGSHLFFFDSSMNKVFRYNDLNVKGEPDNADILRALRATHPEEPSVAQGSTDLEPWRDVYLSNGDVTTHELFLKWFHRESDSKILIERKTSRHITTSELHRKNVILIGRPQTNPLIETLMKHEPQKSRFAFRIHPLNGTLQTSNISLSDFPELASFPASHDGVVGPIWDDRRVFGLFTRFPNPGGRGYITIISCGHYAMVIARIVDAMTNETHAKELLRQMLWSSGEPLPDAFEMVFTVDIVPDGLEGEGFPKLVLWRPC